MDFRVKQAFWQDTNAAKNSNKKDGEVNSQQQQQQQQDFGTWWSREKSTHISSINVQSCCCNEQHIKEGNLYKCECEYNNNKKCRGNAYRKYLEEAYKERLEALESL